MRLLPYEVLDGPANMAADEVLLEAALMGIASLRFYGWSEATVSLGYFQPARVWQDDVRLRSLPMVRRLTGGATLVHHHELTYGLGLPAGHRWQGQWSERLHTLIGAALGRLGVTVQSAPGEQPALSALCFQHPTPGDVLIGQSKVVGSAQRRRRGALLQHGAILLGRSPHTPQLPGIRELTGQDLAPERIMKEIAVGLSKEGWELGKEDWTATERQRSEELRMTRYEQPSWNRKR